MHVPRGERRSWNTCSAPMACRAAWSGWRARATHSASIWS